MDSAIVVPECVPDSFDNLLDSLDSFSSLSSECESLRLMFKYSSVSLRIVRLNLFGRGSSLMGIGFKFALRSIKFCKFESEEQEFL